ncbi:DUF1800 family protein [Aliiglaciecola sp. SL4]|uniref:DUF1800 domain-containing protein n=1 Tax=Aliiglaciecola sp. SL4 TaxID=3239806 RepID=UPI00355ACF4D
MSSKQTFIAVNRFGYGANSQTVAHVKNDALNWLLDQITPKTISHELKQLNYPWSSLLAAEQLAFYRELRDQEKTSIAKVQQPMQQQTSDSTKEIINNQINLAMSHSLSHLLATERPFFWRLVDFFSNHFSVSANGFNLRALAPTLEMEAIAPNLTGHFSDMLIAVESHPAMLLYLNNEKSIGPNSRVGKRGEGKKGINENLAREILELHTLGITAGYTQNDVTELAKAISGWGLSKKGLNGFEFRQIAHEPGSRQIFGKTYSAGGLKQGQEILYDLSVNQKTAEFVSTKLVKHFINDHPPQAIVDGMVIKWAETKGNIFEVVKAMLTNPLSWVEDSSKFKTPREFLISTCRVCGLESIKPSFLKSLAILGQQPFSAGSPAGYEDSKGFWAGPRAMMGRIEWAEHISKFVKKHPLAIGEQALGPLLQKNTVLSIARAETKRQAVTLLLMSPEFQTR